MRTTQTPAATGHFRARGCGFPECERPAVTDAGMCDRHRRVSVSGTGSWLEAG